MPPRGPCLEKSSSRTVTTTAALALPESRREALMPLMHNSPSAVVQPITDPPVSADAPARNPNLASQLASGLSPLELPEPLPAASSDTGLPALPIPGEPGSTAPNGGAQEIILELGGEDSPESDEESEDAPNIAEEPAAPATPPEEDQG